MVLGVVLGVVLAGTEGTADGESLDLLRGIPLDARLGVINGLITRFGTRCWCWFTRSSVMVEGASLGTAERTTLGDSVGNALMALRSP